MTRQQEQRKKSKMGLNRDIGRGPIQMEVRVEVEVDARKERSDIFR